MPFYPRKRARSEALIRIYTDVSNTSGINRNTTKAVLDALWPILKKVMNTGIDVKIPGFGIFHQKMRAARYNSNVNDPSQTVFSPSSALLTFKPDKDWKQEHYVCNANIPTPEEYIKIPYPISYRFYDVIREMYGEDVLNKVYRKL